MPADGAFHWTVNEPLPLVAVAVAPETAPQPASYTAVPVPRPKSVLKLPVVIDCPITKLFEPAEPVTRTQ